MNSYGFLEGHSTVSFGDDMNFDMQVLVTIIKLVVYFGEVLLSYASFSQRFLLG